MRKTTETIKKFNELEWNWPLNIGHTEWQTLYLDKYFGRNENHSLGERVSFFEKIRLSLSLDFTEKRLLLNNYENFSQFQIESFHSVFNEEKEKFDELSESDSDGILTLHIKRELEWSTILNKEYGIYHFFDKYIYPGTIDIERLSEPNLLHKINDFLINNQHYKELLLFSHLIFSKEKIKENILEECFNTSILALVETNECSSTKEIKSSIFYKKINQKNKFLQSLIIIYIFKKYGLSSLTRNDIKTARILFKSSRKIPDLYSSIGFYFLFRGENTTAQSAFNKAIKKYSGNKLGLKNINSLLKKNINNKYYPTSNILRNITRISYSYFIPGTSSSFKETKKEFKKIINTITNDWRNAVIIENLQNIIFLIGMYGNKDQVKQFVNSSLINNHIDKYASKSEKELFSTLQTNNINGINLNSLFDTLSSIGSKSSMLALILQIRAMNCKTALYYNSKEIEMLDINLKKVYLMSLEKNKLTIDNELNWIKL